MDNLSSSSIGGLLTGTTPVTSFNQPSGDNSKFLRDDYSNQLIRMAAGYEMAQDLAQGMALQSAMPDPLNNSSSSSSTTGNAGALTGSFVNTVAPQRLQVLQYDGTQWSPATSPIIAVTINGGLTFQQDGSGQYLVGLTNGESGTIATNVPAYIGMDGKAYIAKYDSLSTSKTLIGFATSNIPPGQTGTFQISGLIKNMFVYQSAGATWYLGATGAVIGFNDLVQQTTSVGLVRMQLGVSVNNTDMWIIRGEPKVV